MIAAGGRVILTREILYHLGVGPGDKVEVDLVAPGRVEIRALRPASGGLGAFVGCLAGPGIPTLTLEEIEEATHEGWAHGGEAGE